MAREISKMTNVFHMSHSKMPNSNPNYAPNNDNSNNTKYRMYNK